MKDIIEIFEINKGFAGMGELKAKGIHTRRIAQVLKEGIIERIKPGLYKFVDYPWDEHEGFADVCNTHKNAVICLLSSA